MWEQLRRFSALPGSARWLFVRACLLLPLLAVALRVSGFQSTKRLLQKRLAQSARGPVDDEHATVEMATRMVLAAARHFFASATCLERSLALWWLLNRQGIASQLRIGVRTDNQKFAAHAWVEHQGVALGEPEAPHLHYTPFSEEMSGEIR
jgi:Transglutaminase-like superfamily